MNGVYGSEKVEERELTAGEWLCVDAPPRRSSVLRGYAASGAFNRACGRPRGVPEMVPGDGEARGGPRLVGIDILVIIGVEPSDINAMALSLYHGQRIMLDQVGGFANGVAMKVVREETFCLCRELVDGVVLISCDAICASMKDMFEEKREGAS